VDRELEVIHKQMEATRESLSDKLGALESQVREGVQVANETVAATVDGVKDVVASVADTVSSVKESVSETVSSVKEGVSETVDSVKETFDIRHHVENYPWAAFGTAVAVGVAGGLFLGPSTLATGAPPRSSGSPPPAPAPANENKSSMPGMLTNLLQNLQGLALGSLVGVARDLVRQSAPKEWQEGLSGVIDDLSLQLTGEKNPKSLIPASLFETESKDRNAGDGATDGSESTWTGAAQSEAREGNGARFRSQR
jgi:ElaB/YqjD/DUF883 family membrane-anchored ribosome-binding protein